MIINRLSDIKRKKVFLDKDDNDRQVEIYSLEDVKFVGENLFYPNAIAYSFLDDKLYHLMEEKTMSLGSLKTRDTLDTFSTETCLVHKESVFFFLYNIDNYYHFLYDSLPYLISFLHLKKEEPEIKLLINFPNPNKKQFYKFILETFELLGISIHDIVLVDSETKYNKVFVSSSFTHGHDSNLPPRKELFEIIKTLTEKALSKKINLELPEKIYISRRSWIHNDTSNMGTNYTTRRRLECEDSLVSRLTEKGYKEIFTENLSMIEKIHLFHNAKKIVGPIGGGLANVLFSGSTTKLFVICSPVFFDINSRFKFCFSNVDTFYYNNTAHVESGLLKKFMRVTTKDGVVGEIVNVTSEDIVIRYCDNNVSGWNNEVRFKEATYPKESVVPLDAGLNSSWTLGVEEFLGWLK